MTSTLLAGNIARIDRTFTRVGDGNVSGSTATVTITDPAGDDVPLEPDQVVVDVDNAAGTVHVVADWEIADDAPAGYRWVTIDVSGGMVAAWQESVYVRQRRSVPTATTATTTTDA